MNYKVFFKNILKATLVCIFHIHVILNFIVFIIVGYCIFTNYKIITVYFPNKYKNFMAYSRQILYWLDIF